MNPRTTSRQLIARSRALRMRSCARCCGSCSGNGVQVLRDRFMLSLWADRVKNRIEAVLVS